MVCGQQLEPWRGFARVAERFGPEGGWVLYPAVLAAGARPLERMASPFDQRVLNALDSRYPRPVSVAALAVELRLTPAVVTEILVRLTRSGQVVSTAAGYLDVTERVRLALSSQPLSPSTLAGRLALSPALVSLKVTRLVALMLAKRIQPDRLNPGVLASQEDIYTTP